MGRWYLINLYTLSSFKGTHLLSPWSDLKIKYGIFWEVFPKGGRGGPLFPNLEAKIPPKSDFFEKNKIAPYGLKCKINHKKFSTKGFPKGGVVGGRVRHLGKIPKKYRFFSWFPPLILSSEASLSFLEVSWRKCQSIKGARWRRLNCLLTQHHLGPLTFDRHFVKILF